MYCMGKIICNICMYQPETNIWIGVIRRYHCIAWEKIIATFVYILTRNWYIYRDNIRRYYCIKWENLMNTCPPIMVSHSGRDMGGHLWFFSKVPYQYWCPLGAAPHLKVTPPRFLPLSPSEKEPPPLKM